jgi:hypothetical protein
MDAGTVNVPFLTSRPDWAKESDVAAKNHEKTRKATNSRDQLRDLCSSTFTIPFCDSFIESCPLNA